jgi:hypothetical protein
MVASFRRKLYRSACLILLILSSGTGFAQRERVYLQLDKYAARPGDTIWLKGTIFSGNLPTRMSTNLYVELFSSKGMLLQRGLFPILHGEAPGQIRIPDSIPSDNYYLRAFTRLQLNVDSENLFTLPIFVYNRDQPNHVLRKKEIPSANNFAIGTIRGVYWLTSRYNGQLSSLVAIDSGEAATRNLHVVKFGAGDSLSQADIHLTATAREQYVLFPIDTFKETETLWLLEDSTLIGRQFLQVREESLPVTLTADTLDTDPTGYNSWFIHLPDSDYCSLSVAVTDADKTPSPPIRICELKRSFTEDMATPIREFDGSFISFSGMATRESGRRIKDEFSREIFFAGARDSGFLFARTSPIDKRGNFRLDSLFFFGDIDLQFQINKEEDGSTKNVKLRLRTFDPPGADSATLAGNWADDSLPTHGKDTVYTRNELTKAELARMTTLRPVVVKGWKSPRKELDNKYTSGAFSEPALYAFDIRTERRFRDIGSYLRANYPRFQGGFSSSDRPTDPLDHTFLFYVDEQNCTWPELQMFDWDRIAYIKCFESDFIGDDPFTKWKNSMANGFSLAGSENRLKVPVEKTPIIIAIYTRKAADFRTMPGGLNKISVKGYSNILKFHPDRTTLYWEPQAFGNSFRIRFTNNDYTRRFRIVIEGYNQAGKVVHLEEVLPQSH